MIDTFGIYNELRQSLGDEPAGKMAKVIQRLYEELSQTVRREDFNELKGVVKELAEAQKRTEARVEELAEAQKKTEQRLDSLTVKVEELAEAQKRTEARVEELAEAQKKTEQRLDSLTVKVEELAEAQKRTEARVEELAEAQKKTEQRLDSLTVKVEELAEAQKKTEQEVAKLAKGLQRTNTELGGLSRSVSYALENEAFRYLPSLLKERFGIEISDRMVRTEMGEEEINIFAKGRKNGEEVIVVGETKLRLQSVNDLKQLDRKMKAVRQWYRDTKIVPIMVTHFAKRRVLERASEKGIAIVQSFEW